MQGGNASLRGNMRIPIGFVLFGASAGAAGIAGVLAQPSFAGPSTNPTIVYGYCDTRGLPLQPGERLLQRSYVADCCPRVEERLLYDPKTRRYRTIVVETNERCEAGPSSSERIFSVFPNR